MPEITPETPSPNTTKGDCYKAAYDSVVELAEIGQSPTLVHGSIVPLNGPNKGQRIRHAWIEMSGNCIEVSNGQQEPFGKDSYYSNLNAECIVEYSASEALQNAKATGHYGRWDT